MRPFVLPAIALVFACALPIGAHAQTPAPSASPLRPAPGQLMSEVFYEPSQRIVVPAGVRFLIALGSNPTTGYRWLPPGISSPEVLKSLGDAYLPNGKARVPGTLAAPTLMGGGGTQLFLLEALAPGTVSVSFGYRRPFESKPPVQQRRFTVEVTK